MELEALGAFDDHRETLPEVQNLQARRQRAMRLGRQKWEELEEQALEQAVLRTGRVVGESNVIRKWCWNGKHCRNQRYSCRYLHPPLPELASLEVLLRNNPLPLPKKQPAAHGDNTSFFAACKPLYVSTGKAEASAKDGLFAMLHLQCVAGILGFLPIRNIFLCRAVAADFQSASIMAIQSQTWSILLDEIQPTRRKVPDEWFKYHYSSSFSTRGKPLESVCLGPDGQNYGSKLSCELVRKNSDAWSTFRDEAHKRETIRCRKAAIAACRSVGTIEVCSIGCSRRPWRYTYEEDDSNFGEIEQSCLMAGLQISFFASPRQSLQALDLSCIRSKFIGSALLSAVASSCTNLRTLFLAKGTGEFSSFDDADGKDNHPMVAECGGRGVSGVLKANPMLEEVRLGGFACTPDDVRALSAAGKALRSLDLCTPAESCCSLLPAVLVQFESLEELVLRSEGLDETVLLSMVPNLAHLPLDSLELHDSVTTDAALFAIADSLSSLRSLKVKIARVYHGGRLLRHNNVFESLVTPEAVEALKLKYPDRTFEIESSDYNIEDHEYDTDDDLSDYILDPEVRDTMRSERRATRDHPIECEECGRYLVCEYFCDKCANLNVLALCRCWETPDCTSSGVPYY